MKAFYKNTETLKWELVDDLDNLLQLPAGNYGLKTNSSKTNIWISEGINTIDSGVITDVIKDTETGDKYADFAEFDTVTKDFFVDAALIAAEELAVRVTSLENKALDVLYLDWWGNENDLPDPLSEGSYGIAYVDGEVNPLKVSIVYVVIDGAWNLLANYLTDANSKDRIYINRTTNIQYDWNGTVMNPLTFPLTKTGIEAVLTGDISSHTHSTYVEKVTGKGLSTNDYDNTDKAKVGTITDLKTLNGNSLRGTGDLVVASTGAAVVSTYGQSTTSVIVQKTISDTKELTDKASIKKIDLSGYANKQILTITQGFTGGASIQWIIPKAILVANYVIKFQFKSLNGANSPNVKLYTQNPTVTVVGTVVWTLSIDGFYYSQLFSVTVSQADIDNNAYYNIFLQGYNGAGLNADTITLAYQQMYKLEYVDANSIVTQLEQNYKDIPSKNHILVREDGSGTGGFTNFMSAINSITDASVTNQYVVEFDRDITVTDMTKLYKVATPTVNSGATPAEDVALIITKDWVHVRSLNNNRITLNGPTNLTATAYQYIQIIYKKGNSKDSNMILDLMGGRYPKHQESGGNVSSPDYHAKTTAENTECIHRGNSVDDGYPVGAWSSNMAEANGTCAGLKQVYKGCKWKSNNAVPFYFHSNGEFDEATEHNFENCTISPMKNFDLNSFDAYYGDLGSGRRAKIRMIGCNIPKFSILNSIHNTEQTLNSCDLYMNGGADFEGHGNIPMLCITEFPKTLCFTAVTNGANIDVTGGTAYSSVFGGNLNRYAATADKPGSVWGIKRIENPNLSLGASQIFSLAYRLGNCATVNKTLTLTVGGVNYTITFNQNYMTANGSAYSWSTVPAVSEASIVADINAAYPGVFQCHNNVLLKLIVPSDCSEDAVNVSAKTINTGNGLIRDVANGVNCYRLSQIGEKAEAIASERINIGSGNNYDTGKVILIKKAIFQATVLGVAVTKGYYYKCAADGAFIYTADKTEACLYAIDNYNLVGI